MKPFLSAPIGIYDKISTPQPAPELAKFTPGSKWVLPNGFLLEIICVDRTPLDTWTLRYKWTNGQQSGVGVMDTEHAQLLKPFPSDPNLAKFVPGSQWRTHDDQIITVESWHQSATGDWKLNYKAGVETGSMGMHHILLLTLTRAEESGEPTDWTLLRRLFDSNTGSWSPWEIVTAPDERRSTLAETKIAVTAWINMGGRYHYKVLDHTADRIIWQLRC